MLSKIETPKTIHYVIRIMASNQRPDRTELDKYHRDNVPLVIKYEEEIWIYGLALDGTTQLIGYTECTTQKGWRDLYKNLPFTQEPKILRERVDEIRQEIDSSGTHHPEALNETQKTIIAAWLKYPLKDIVSSLKEFPFQIVYALQELLLNYLREKDILKPVWSSFEEIQQILLHSCPQNRRVGDPAAAHYQLDGITRDEQGVEWVHYWTVDDSGNSITASERRGLLGLTAKNNETAPPVTKQAVIDYIKRLVGKVSTKAEQAFQRKAVEELQDTGLTTAHFKNWVSSQFFTEKHKNALVYLIRSRQFLPEAAIAEINGLNNYQVVAIPEGFNRSEVFELGERRVEALRALRKFGLTREHLNGWQDCHHFWFGGDYFLQEHKDALVYLVRDKGMPPKLAIAEIYELSYEQAERVTKGETREQVLKTSKPALNPDSNSSSGLSTHLWKRHEF
jgi:hypothetical protein